VASGVEPFRFTLVELGEFPGCLWLRPHPEQPFRYITDALHRAFPSYAPYDGKFAENRPHLTIAQTSSDQVLRDVRTDLTNALQRKAPVNGVASAVSLFTSDATGLWQLHTRFPFRG
jgi:hypothetical protein